jgi:hypothetical protein
MVEPVTGWFDGRTKHMIGDSKRVKSGGAAMLLCKPTEAMAEDVASTPEETFVFNIDSDSQNVISDAVDPILVPVEPEDSPKFLPANCTTKLPEAGAHNRKTFETSALDKETLANIFVVCVDGRDTTIL